MKLSQVLALNSERGIRSALSALTFGAKQRLLSISVQHERMTRTISNLNAAGYADRAADVENGKAFKQVDARALEAADQLSLLVAAADSHGVVIDLDIEPTMRRLMDAKQLSLAAQFSGLTEDTIKAAALSSAKTQFEQEQQASLHAQTLFYTACSQDDVDLDVKAESILSALMRERDRILTYSNIMPYLGELGLLKKDIDTVEWIIANTVDDEHTPDVADMIVEPTAPAASKQRKLRAVKAKKAAEEQCELDDIRDSEVTAD
jgi:hypothetical protein